MSREEAGRSIDPVSAPEGTWPAALLRSPMPTLDVDVCARRASAGSRVASPTLDTLVAAKKIAAGPKDHAAVMQLEAIKRVQDRDSRQNEQP